MREGPDLAKVVLSVVVDYTVVLLFSSYAVEPGVGVDGCEKGLRLELGYVVWEIFEAFNLLILGVFGKKDVGVVADCLGVIKFKLVCEFHFMFVNIRLRFSFYLLKLFFLLRI